MIIRDVAFGGGKEAGSRRKEPTRHRAWLFTLLTLGAGAGSGVAALIATTLLVNVQTLVTDVGAQNNAPPPLEARTVFPSVPPVHKVIDVYDPPAARPVSPTTQPRPAASPTPHHRPSPSPTHDDGGDHGGDGGGGDH
jgi:hypothetical protein